MKLQTLTNSKYILSTKIKLKTNRRTISFKFNFYILNKNNINKNLYYD